MKFIGRWLSTDGVVHVDNPYKRKGYVSGYLDIGVHVRNRFTGRTEYERTLERHPCGRSSMAIHKYLKRDTVVTCLTCLIATLETPGESSTASIKSRVASTPATPIARRRSAGSRRTGRKSTRRLVTT